MASEVSSIWQVLEEVALDKAWHSPLYSEGALKYSREKTGDNADEDRSITLTAPSLFIHDKGQLVICCIGNVINDGDKKGFGAYELPSVCIENRKLLTRKLRRAFLREFDRITAEVEGKIRMTDYLEGGVLSTLASHLVSKGARTLPRYLRVIDLDSSIAELKRARRESYKSLINWGMRELKPIVVDKENVKWEDIDTLRQLHIKEAGRETRSEASWRLQYQMVRAGEAFVVIGNLQNQPVSAGLYLVNRTNCNYWVSASRRDLFQKPLFHALMWTAILHAKALGCRWFEMGQEVHPSFTMERAPTQKELDISRFKTGFGGETRVYLDLELRHR